MNAHDLAILATSPQACQARRQAIDDGVQGIVQGLRSVAARGGLQATFTIPRDYMQDIMKALGSMDFDIRWSDDELLGTAAGINLVVSLDSSYKAIQKP